MKRKYRKPLRITAAVVLLLAVIMACKNKDSFTGSGSGNPPPGPQPTDIILYLTKADQTARFQKQNLSLLFATGTPSYPVIDVDTSQTFQTIDGFGYTLTGGSATLINSLPATQKDDLIKELFAWDSTHIGVSYLRVS